MKRIEIWAIKQAANEIKRTAAMETCGINFPTEGLREQTRLWCMSFIANADKILEALGEKTEEYQESRDPEISFYERAKQSIINKANNTAY